jgi:hypothetical protein
VIRTYTDGLQNLFLVGRSAVRRRNNHDHFLLTAMTAVQNVVSGVSFKGNIWRISTEGEYLEETPRSEPARDSLLHQVTR